MTLAARKPPKSLTGRSLPRVAPPVPARHDLPAFRQTADSMGISLMPWQETAAKYLTAKGAGDLHLYREVCIVVARQNGKTTLMKPLIVAALKAGKKVMHLAQTRELPREMFDAIASSLDESLFPKRRRGNRLVTVWPRYGQGQEEILLANGGSYRIAAASRGGARGRSNDLVIIDELREMDSDEIIGAAEPTLLMSADPQMIYLSNAGDDSSVVLNAVRDRAGLDESLAYLEWSAAPERAVDDREGWAEANPAVGHMPAAMTGLEASYRRHSLGGSLARFETENLCRWVASLRERLVDDFSWNECRSEPVAPSAPVMAVSMDPERRRASAAIAWLREDGVGLTVVRDVSANPIDTDALGQDLRKLAGELGVRRIAYDPLTDGELAKYFKKPEPVSGQKFANASSQFAGLVAARSLRHHDAQAVGDDLTWTARKLDRETGRFEAVRAQDDRPITAALAAIRAVWLASGLRLARPRVM